MSAAVEPQQHASPRWTHFIKLAAELAGPVVLVGGGVFYAISRSMYVAFYAPLGVTPEDVGLSQTVVLAQMGALGGLAALLISIIAVGGLLTYRIEKSVSSLEQTMGPHQRPDRRQTWEAVAVFVVPIFLMAAARTLGGNITFVIFVAESAYFWAYSTFRGEALRSRGGDVWRRRLAVSAAAVFVGVLTALLYRFGFASRQSLTMVLLLVLFLSFMRLVVHYPGRALINIRSLILRSSPLIGLAFVLTPLLLVTLPEATANWAFELLLLSLIGGMVVNRVVVDLLHESGQRDSHRLFDLRLQHVLVPITLLASNRRHSRSR